MVLTLLDEDLQRGSEQSANDSVVVTTTLHILSPLWLKQNITSLVKSQALSGLSLRREENNFSNVCLLDGDGIHHFSCLFIK